MNNEPNTTEEKIEEGAGNEDVKLIPESAGGSNKTIYIVIGVVVVLVVVGVVAGVMMRSANKGVEGLGEDSHLYDVENVGEILEQDDEVLNGSGATIDDGLVQVDGEPAEDGHGHGAVLSVASLPKLQEGTYEAWAVTGSEKVSLGTFEPGAAVSLGGDADLHDADQIVITIEPAGDSDSNPSDVVVLSGEVTESKEGADVVLKFPVDLSAVAGNYVIATPTDGHGTNELSGVWFLKVPGPTVGMTLPALPTGWAYEGWVVNQGVPLTSGRFTSATGADLFDSFSGPRAAPKFPGEDYLVNAPSGFTFPINLADGTSKAVITLEPDIDGVDPTGSGPFPIDFLEADIPLGVAPDTNQAMTANTGLCTYRDGCNTVKGC